MIRSPPPEFGIKSTEFPDHVPVFWYEQLWVSGKGLSHFDE